DVDLGAPYALVAEIAIVVLVVPIKRLEPGIGRQIEIERASLLLGTRAAALMVTLQPHALRRRRRIELPLAVRQHELVLRSEPPVHEVEVMGRLVHHQTTRDLLLAMPTPEVVGAMNRIQQIGRA